MKNKITAFKPHIKCELNDFLNYFEEQNREAGLSLITTFVKDNPILMFLLKDKGFNYSLKDVQSSKTMFQQCKNDFLHAIDRIVTFMSQKNLTKNELKKIVLNDTDDDNLLSKFIDYIWEEKFQMTSLDFSSFKDYHTHIKEYDKHFYEFENDSLIRLLMQEFSRLKLVTPTMVSKSHSRRKKGVKFVPSRVSERKIDTPLHQINFSVMASSLKKEKNDAKYSGDLCSFLNNAVININIFLEVYPLINMFFQETKPYQDYMKLLDSKIEKSTTYPSYLKKRYKYGNYPGLYGFYTLGFDLMNQNIDNLRGDLRNSLFNSFVMILENFAGIQETIKNKKRYKTEENFETKLYNDFVSSFKIISIRIKDLLKDMSGMTPEKIKEDTFIERLKKIKCNDQGKIKEAFSEKFLIVDKNGFVKFNKLEPIGKASLHCFPVFREYVAIIFNKF